MSGNYLATGLNELTTEPLRLAERLPPAAYTGLSSRPMGRHGMSRTLKTARPRARAIAL